MSNFDDSIMAPLRLAENCPFSAGACRTLDKSLCVYSPSDERLTCPDLTISVSGTLSSQICNLNVGTSLQGMYYTPDRPGDSDHKLATTEQIARATRVTISSKTKRRVPQFTAPELEIKICNRQSLQQQQLRIEPQKLHKHCLIR